MPIADAQVAFNINWQPWWRWWNEGGTASYGGNVTTDGQGRFEIELPTENLKGSKYERGIYTLSVSATSSSGETQSAPDFRFALGAGLSVLPSIPEKVCIGGDSIKLNVPVYDMLGHPVAGYRGFCYERRGHWKRRKVGVIYKSFADVRQRYAFRTI